jgi:hypothetical protein
LELLYEGLLPISGQCRLELGEKIMLLLELLYEVYL